MSEELVKVENVSKTYRSGLARREVKALDGVAFSVERGSVVAFIGPNGAGKTTTIFSLLGLVKPQTGSVSLFGLPAGSQEVRKRIGFQSEIFMTYPFKTARQTLEFHGRLAGIPATTLKEAIPAQLNRLGLGEAIDRRVGAFSKGMTQRLGLAQALLHQPELLLLDEPTTGLDPEGRKLIADIVREEKMRGTTVFLSSHILSDAERTSDHVLIIRKGRIVFSQAMGAIAATGSEDRWKITVAGWNPATADLLHSLGFQPTTSTEAGTAGFECAAGQKNLLLRHLLDLPVDITEVRQQRRSLEDLYMEYAGGSSSG